MLRINRLKREIEKLQKNPPDGIKFEMEDDKIDKFYAEITGPPETPYVNGLFRLEINIPEKYPFEPPMIKFITKIYHPNIDTEGRICLDLLKMPPSGNWKPAASLEGLLVAIGMLLKYPNPEDPLMMEIADEFKNMKEVFEKKAAEYTQKYA